MCSGRKSCSHRSEIVWTLDPDLHLDPVTSGVGVGGDVKVRSGVGVGVRVCTCEKRSGWVVVRLGVGVRVGGWE